MSFVSSRSPEQQRRESVNSALANAVDDALANIPSMDARFSKERSASRAGI
jgi:hypothetical protein